MTSAVVWHDKNMWFQRMKYSVWCAIGFSPSSSNFPFPTSWERTRQRAARTFRLPRLCHLVYFPCGENSSRRLGWSGQGCMMMSCSEQFGRLSGVLEAGTGRGLRVPTAPRIKWGCRTPREGKEREREGETESDISGTHGTVYYQRGERKIKWGRGK